MLFTVVLVCFAYLGLARAVGTSGLPATAKYVLTAPDTVEFDKVGVRRKRAAWAQWIDHLGSAMMSTFQKEPYLQDEVFSNAKSKKPLKSMMQKLNNFKCLPKMIVFDLDCTLWPFWVDTHVDPPFHRNSKGHIIDSMDRRIKSYPESNDILHLLSKTSIGISAASRTGEIDGAKQLLHLFGWNKYFTNKQIYPGTKDVHLKRISDATNVGIGDMLFFDDEYQNIVETKHMGIVAVHVVHGMSKDLLLKGLKKYSDARS